MSPQPLKEYEQELRKKIHPTIKLIINWDGAPDCAGVYVGDYYLGITIPSRGVFNHRNPNYTDKNGVVWRSKPEIEELIFHKMSKLQKDIRSGIYDD